MEFKGTRRWLKEGGIESRCMGFMDTAKREEGRSRDEPREHKKEQLENDDYQYYKTNKKKKRSNYKEKPSC